MNSEKKIIFGFMLLAKSGPYGENHQSFRDGKGVKGGARETLSEVATTSAFLGETATQLRV